MLTDWGTRYQASHPTLPSIQDFSITDNDFDEFKQFAREQNFKYDRLSEKRLADLKKTAQFEGYYDDAKEEFEALEKKLVHNMEREMDTYKDDIMQLMAVEVVRRYYYQAGTIQETLKKDPDLLKATELLGTPDAYRRILTPASSSEPVSE